MYVASFAPALQNCRYNLDSGFPGVDLFRRSASQSKGYRASSIRATGLFDMPINYRMAGARDSHARSMCRADSDSLGWPDLNRRPLDPQTGTGGFGNPVIRGHLPLTWALAARRLSSFCSVFHSPADFSRTLGSLAVPNSGMDDARRSLVIGPVGCARCAQTRASRRSASSSSSSITSPKRSTSRRIGAAYPARSRSPSSS